MSLDVVHADCLQHLATIPDQSIDAICTDPPYNLGFMGKSWDSHGGHTEDAGFCYWLAGLIDGEGHFGIKKHTRGSHAPFFALKMRGDEEATLRMIQRQTGFGNIVIERRDPHDMVKWLVQDKAGCQALVDLLDKYPLRAKKHMDFLVWREAVCEWTDRPRGNRWYGGADNTRMAELRTQIMAVRQYVDPPWSGHAFQDWCRVWATECLRVLKPGGFLLSFGSSRTSHRLAAGLEDAGFDIRDSIIWMYSSGFPKSRNVAAAVDAHLGVQGAYDGVKAGHEDFVDRTDAHAAGGRSDGWDREWKQDADAVARSHQRYVPASEQGQRRDGWGTALKPSHEPIIVARKPLEGTIGANVAVHGVGGINIDGCRIPTNDRFGGGAKATSGFVDGYENDGWVPGDEGGRWPPNVVLSHDPDCRLVGERVAKGDSRSPYELGRRGQVFAPGAPAGDDRPNGVMYGDEVIDAWQCVPGCPVAHLDAQAGERRSGAPGVMRLGVNSSDAFGTESRAPGTPMTGYGDSGSASRFFPTFAWDFDLDEPFIYQAKASRAERDAGLDGFDIKPILWSSGEQNPGSFQSPGTVKAARNNHPTVKPVGLMRWLVRLVTPPEGTLLDPFTGSGTTGVAAAIEGVNFLGIEKRDDYAAIARARVDHAHTVRDVVRNGAKLRVAAKAPEGQEALF